MSVVVTDDDKLPEMSEYERQAWEQLKKQGLKRERRKIVKPETRRKLNDGAHKIAERVRKVPGAELAEQATTTALEGLRVVTMDAAMSSVSISRVHKRFDNAGVQVDSWEQIRKLDLQTCDEAMPKLRLRYSTASAAQGAGASLLITGATVSTTVSGGVAAPIVVGAIAGDIALVLAAMGRVVAETGAYYGYDVSTEEEQVYALAIIAYSSAATQPAKAAALVELSKLTQMMMRRATWKTLGEQPLVKVIQHVYARLGIRLTKGGLSKAVPLVGALMGAGMNGAALQRVARDARFAYRIRMLSDKYDLDLTDFFARMAQTDEADDEDIIRIELPDQDEPGAGSGFVDAQVEPESPEDDPLDQKGHDEDAD